MGLDYDAFMDYINLPDELAADIPFDIHSRDIEEFAFLQKSIPGIIVSSAGGICPFQVEGLLEGYYFYLRARHDYTSLSVAVEKEDVYLNPLWSSGVEGDADFNNLEEKLVVLVASLSRSKRLFEFEGFRPVSKDGVWSVDKTTKDTMYARGFSAEEAYNSLFEPLSEDDADYISTSSEEWVKVLKNCEFNPTPLSGFIPEYPDPEPIFRVSL